MREGGIGEDRREGWEQMGGCWIKMEEGGGREEELLKCH